MTLKKYETNAPFKFEPIDEAWLRILNEKWQEGHTLEFYWSVKGYKGFLSSFEAEGINTFLYEINQIEANDKQRKVLFLSNQFQRVTPNTPETWLFVDTKATSIASFLNRIDVCVFATDTSFQFIKKSTTDWKKELEGSDLPYNQEWHEACVNRGFQTIQISGSKKIRHGFKDELEAVVNNLPEYFKRKIERGISSTALFTEICTHLSCELWCSVDVSFRQERVILTICKDNQELNVQFTSEFLRRLRPELMLKVFVDRFGRL